MDFIAQLSHRCGNSSGIAALLLTLAIWACDRPDTLREERASTVDSARLGSEVSSVADTVESPALVMVAVVDPREEESGISERTVESGPPGAHLRANVLYAESQSVLRAIAESADVRLADGAVLVDGVPVGAPAHRHGDAIYVALKPFARHFRAFTKLENRGRWARIFPESALRYLRDNRESPEKVPILQEARAEGLWPRS
jgi:hypothetical protein